MRSRRQILDALQPRADTHAGLWLDTFREEQRNADGTNPEAAKGAPTKLIEQAGRLTVPDGYPAAFERWKAGFSEETATVVSARATGRIAIGLGNASPIEVGLTLDHTWGVPILPGSALKGLAAAAARHLHDSPEWIPGGKSYDTLFGTTEVAGAVDFMDAWWDPRGAALPIHLDVMTVHHAQYYMTGSVPPADTDAPNPVSFATVNGKYLFVVVGPKAWREAAMTLLSEGMSNLGIGAKTNAGYGRMHVSFSPPLPPPPPEPFEDRLARVSKTTASDLMPGLIEEANPDQRPRVMTAGRKLTRAWLEERSSEPWTLPVLESFPAEDPNLSRVHAAGSDKNPLRALGEARLAETDWSKEAHRALMRALRDALPPRKKRKKDPNPASFEGWWADREARLKKLKPE